MMPANHKIVIPFTCKTKKVPAINAGTAMKRMFYAFSGQ